MNEDAELSRIPKTIEARAVPFGKMSFAFGRRFFVALAIGLAWLVPAWWTPRFVVAMFLWDGLFLAAWLFDLTRLPKPQAILVRRVWRSRPALSVASNIGIEISSARARALQVMVVDETPSSLAIQPPQLKLIAPANGTGVASYAILPRRRGQAKLGRTFLRYQSMLHLAERRGVADTGQVVRVLPNVVEARKQTLALIRSRQADIERRRYRQQGLGRELDSLREYREGDDFRDISWTATARRHRPITRVFQMERSQTVWIVLDAGRLLRAEIEEPGGAQRLSKLDYAVNAALSLAQVALHCGDRVGLMAYGSRLQQRVNPGQGAQHFRVCADALAEVHAESSEPEHGRAVRALLNAQKRRSLVVWITDFAETATQPEVIDYAMQITPRHLVIFAAMSQPELSTLADAIPSSTHDMYRHAAAYEIRQRRDTLLRRLRQRGVLAFEWLPWGLSTPLVNQYLDAKERNRI